MPTFIYLLSAFVLIFVISRLTKVNRIDEFSKLLASLAVGLILGAGCHYVDTKISTKDNSEKAVVVTTATNPIQNASNTPVVLESVSNNNSVGKEVVGDTVITETEGPKEEPRTTAILDDS